MAAELEPPTRPYAATELASVSAKSSSTHIEMEGGVGVGSTAMGQPLQDTNPSNEPLAPIVAKEEPSALGSSEPKSPSNTELLAPEPAVPQTPQVYLTFLIISGRRRTMSFEPDTTVGRVKELVWNAWPTDWEDERPLAPSFLRVLYLGKMLQDDDTLTQLKFPTHTPQSIPAPAPTIVHLSIRPFAAQGDGDIKKKRGRGRSGDTGIQSSIGDNNEDNGTGGCCGCVIC